MSNFLYWKRQERKFIQLTKIAAFPTLDLSKLDFVDIKQLSDFDQIPKKNGCYWIWTSERIVHSFHSDRTPKEIKVRIKNRRIKGEIIYNGVSQNIYGRVKKEHLLADVNEGWSGISIDIYFKNVRSHKKRAMGPKNKVPYIGADPIRTKKELLKLNFSKKERDYIRKTKKRELFFRNGINVFDEKHKKHTYRVYYIADIDPLYVGFIEKKWREKYGRPKLCYYKEGR